MRIHCHFNILAPLVADFISADYPYLRHITECSGLVSDQVLAVEVFAALFLRSDGSLSKFPFSGIGCEQN